MYSAEKKKSPTERENNKWLYSHIVEGCSYPNNTLLLEKGFFILLVTNGTASISDIYQQTMVEKQDLLVLTPSLSCRLQKMSEDFSMTCLYLVPDFFDSLPEGQPMYDQLTKYRNNHHLPLLHLKNDTYEYLRQTTLLCFGHLNDFGRHRDEIIRHLCSLLLLQIAEILRWDNSNATTDTTRVYEIFRRFKKLMLTHYRNHHDISFYADKLHISTTYLSRIVKKITGRTVCFHLSELICADAKHLLDCTEYDIKEIAQMLGFSDQSVFGKFFIKKTGFSPSKFRLRKENEKIPQKGQTGSIS